MEVRYLQLIKAIVEEGILTQAAKRLHLTQSALSHQLREFESQLEADVFHRVNNKLVLTKAGKRVYQSADKILDQLDQLDQEVKEITLGETGEIVLCTECYTSYYSLPPVMKKFAQKYPNVDVCINMDGTHHPLDLLLNGELDLAFTSDPVEKNQILYEELFQDEMFAVVSSDHCWAKKKFVEAEDFESETLIIHSKPLKSVTVYNKVLEPNGIEPDEITVLPLTEASIEMVKADLGVIVMPEWAIKPYLNSRELSTVKVTTEGLHRTHYSADLDQDHPGYLNDFIEYV
ncbi:MAG: LysR family transcriptional regulator [Balneolaceae bacterium]|nr:LysR family transcriptional regulator [Balneolaceae bacterium]